MKIGATEGREWMDQVNFQSLPCITSQSTGQAHVDFVEFHPYPGGRTLPGFLDQPPPNHGGKKSRISRVRVEELETLDYLGDLCQEEQLVHRMRRCIWISSIASLEFTKSREAALIRCADSSFHELMSSSGFPTILRCDRGYLGPSNLQS